MAPSEVSAFLPPLDKCLDGNRQLLSWKLAFAALMDESPAVGDKKLGQFLLSVDTIEVLVRSLDPSIGPTSNSRAKFDNHTAAINLAPNGNGEYNAQQIKGDALWLSELVGLDEVSALRLVVLEWQARPTLKLLYALPHEEVPVSGGSSKLKSSLLASISRQPARQVLDDGDKFESERPRRLRLLETYLSETQLQYKLLEHILFYSLYEPSLGTPHNIGEGATVAVDKNYIHVAGGLILKAWNVDGSSSNGSKNWLVDAAGLISLKLKSIETGSGLNIEGGGNEELEMSWCKTRALEIIYLMHTILIVVQHSPRIPRSDEFSSWFRLMDSVCFFGYFELPFPSLDDAYAYHLRSLATLVSLALIKLPLALENLPEMSLVSSTGEADGKTPYNQNVECVVDVTRTILNAAAHASSPAQPVALAWSIVLQDARSFANASQETRDLRQSQKAIESIGPSQHSDTESNDSSSSRQRPPPYRRTSFGSDTSQQQTYLEELVEAVGKIEQNEDVISFLARSAFQGLGSFSIMTDLAIRFCTSFGSELKGKPGMKMRLLLLGLIRAALDYVEYQPDLVQTALAIISGGKSHWEIRGPLRNFYDFDPSCVFFNDRSLMDRIYGVALSRFPYEAVPYLKLCEALAYAQPLTGQYEEPMSAKLQELHTFTSILYEDETTYELVSEADFFIRLSSPLDAMAALERGRAPKVQSIRLPSTGTAPSQGFMLPEGTPGRSLTDVKPLVVLFRFEYSGLRYMGLVLQRALELRLSARLNSADSTLEAASEILGLLTTLLRATITNQTDGPAQDNSQMVAQSILEAVSDGLDRNNDIVSLVFGLFEDELYREKPGTTREDSTELLVHCIQFTHALLAVLPGRVWPFLGRSGMLGLDGLESRLASVVAMTEVATGHFPLLRSAVHLFEALVEDTIVHSVSRKRISNAVNRYGASAPDPNGAGVTEHVMKKIILHFARILIEVFESCGNWRFASIGERLDVNTTICTTFNQILTYVFDIDDTPDLSEKISGVLAPAAEYLLDVFLSQATNDLPIEPLLQIFNDGLNTPISNLSVQGVIDWTMQTEAVLALICRLVRINAFLDRPPCRLEEQLFDSTPILARLHAVHPTYRLPVVKLLDALVRGASNTIGQPPSLLGRLGQSTAKCFLQLLSHFDEPLDNQELSITTWKLLSAIVSQRQQWFAIYILTGNTPKDSLKAKDAPLEKSSLHPVLDIAVKRLCNLERLDPAEAVNVLEFVALSMDFWPWVCEEIRRNADLIKAFTSFLSNLQDRTLVPETKQSLSETFELQMAAFISSILAMVVHRCAEFDEPEFAKNLMPHLTYLIRHGVSTPSYNSSLHGSLRKNFEVRYSKCKLANFKRTSLCQPDLGINFYYDLGIASKVLQHDSAWQAKGGQGFCDELGRANLNLSFVEAQMNLFHGWKSLAVELSIVLSGDVTVQASMGQVIRNCLHRNLENNLPGLIFNKLAQSRANLAFVLLQRLLETSGGSSEALSLLKPAWETLRANAPDLGAALTGPDSDYNRTLLKILYLALRAHVPNTPQNPSKRSETRMVPSDVTFVVLEILGTCVSQGFRSLVTLLHDGFTKVLPDDIALVNAVLRTCLHIPEVDRNTEQLVAHFADDNTARYASTLLSWADQLTIDQDPILGELSLTFLVELSTVPVLAEYIVTGGSLAQIGTTNLMKYFLRPGGTGPFDEPARMYGVWTHGILPLALNLLGAIGAPIVADIAAFINQFQSQLQRASSSLDPKPAPTQSHGLAGYITLAMASEVHSLALICAIIEMFRGAGASAGIAPSDVAQITWDRISVKADLENRLQRRITLRDDIIATTQREEAWLRQKPRRNLNESANRLEERVVDDLKAALALMADVDQ